MPVEMHWFISLFVVFLLLDPTFTKFTFSWNHVVSKVAELLSGYHGGETKQKGQSRSGVTKLFKPEQHFNGSES